MSPARPSCAGGGIALVVSLAALSLGSLSAQAVTVAVIGDAVHVRAPGFRFLQGDVLSRLHDGRAVQIDARLDILARHDGPPMAHAEQAFVISYDLWEERFAVTRAGTPPRSVTHLTSPAAEAWCVDGVTVPVASLAAARAAPIWIRLTLRPAADTPAAADGETQPFSMRRLIDAFSLRTPPAAPSRIVEGGPFRLSN